MTLTIADSGRHCGRVVSTVASQREGPPASRGLSVWDLHFLPVAEWVLTRYSGFCQRQVCSSKLTVAVAVVSFSQQICTRELTLRQFKVFQIPNFGMQFA